ncbi:hypothetical protein HDU97_001544 [Phlyctochytrium planicorne]|nr:hypothetical protein HDU97_001544 [Phlyctochytrium planicorne]
MHEQSGLFLIELDNVVSSAESEQMIKLDDPKSYRSVSGTYEISKRQGSRLLAIDEQTSSIIWNRIQNPIYGIVSDKSIPLAPLGFDVSAGDWRLDSLNEALRLNLYDSASNFFAPHVDAQYCPSGDRRSRFSVVLYLTDEFDEGETTFYFPKEPLTAETALNYKGLTIDEEIAARGGLADGFDAITIKPKKGKAIIFSHNIIHEAKPLSPRPDTPNSKRIILRTDIMVKRVIGARGFVVSEAETKDYQLALSYFREAQQMELEKKVDKAGELLPTEIITKIAEALNPIDSQKLVLAFPDLLWTQSMTERHHSSSIQSSTAFKKLQSLKSFLPDNPDEYEFAWPGYSSIKGSACAFIYDDVDFFMDNIEGCCRAVAVLAFFQFGHCNKLGPYTVSYNPVTQEAKAVDFKEVVAAAFYNKPCYGSIFKVIPRTPGIVDPKSDFDNSVDRTYMTQRFGTQFVGTDYVRNFHTSVVPVSAHDLGYMIPGKSDEEEEEHSDGDDGYTSVGHSTLSGFKKFSTPIRSIEKERSTWPEFFKQLSLVQRYVNNFPEVFFWDYYGYYDHSDPNHKYKLERPLAPDGVREQSDLVDLNDTISPCLCPLGGPVQANVVRPINDLVFDFSRSTLTVTEEESFETYRPDSCRSCAAVDDGPGKTFRDVEDSSQIMRFRVDITPLAMGDRFESFNHAGCQCAYPDLDVNMLDVVSYRHLDHVHLRCWVNRDDGKVFVYAAYGGIVAL